MLARGGRRPTAVVTVFRDESPRLQPWEEVIEDIRALRETVGEKALKCIIEPPVFSGDEILV